MSKIIIELKQQELDLLIKYSLVDNMHTSQDRDKILLSGTHDSFEFLLGKLSEFLIEEGLAPPTDEPNELGLKIETIIDIVSREVYSSK